MRFRFAPVLLCLLLAFSGICTSLCAAPSMADLQHPCCPQHQSDRSCAHAATGQDSVAIVRHVSLDAPLAVLPAPLHLAEPVSAPLTAAPLAVTADLSPHRHFILRL